MRGFKRTLGLIFLIMIIAGGIFAYTQYRSVFGPSVPEGLPDYSLEIPNELNINELAELLKKRSLINSVNALKRTGKLMKFGSTSSVKPGYYILEPNWSNRELLQVLRLGHQKPVKVTIVNERFPEEIAGKVAEKLRTDSIEIVEAIFNSDNMALHKATRETILCSFIPNTYEMYWTTTGEEFAKRMLDEKKKFWASNDRMAKAEALNLSQNEVYILASIVERETQYKPERSKIAGVYLNRLERGIPLQADPTVVFANGIFDTRRVLHRHLEFDSPYNTYKYQGLPPGPIGSASISAIDAVLNAEKHDYIFFCAKADNSGKHAFAKTLREHNNNAREFHRWLNSRGIR